MAFEIARKTVTQIEPNFSVGYPYETRYHNVGQLQAPYVGKIFGMGGDYGPPQATVYYTPNNRTYPYVLDKDFRPEQFIPEVTYTSPLPNFQYPGYFWGYNPQYPDTFVPPNYFTPNPSRIGGHYVSPLGKQSLPPTTITRSPVGPPAKRTNKSDFMKTAEEVFPGLKQETPFESNANAMVGPGSSLESFEFEKLRYAYTPLQGKRTWSSR